NRRGSGRREPQACRSGCASGAGENSEAAIAFADPRESQGELERQPGRIAPARIRGATVTGIERVEVETAYVLQARPWRETSQLLEVMTRLHGRIGLVARGARGRRSRWSGVLEPFQPLRLSWSGRGTLYTLRAAEPARPPELLQGDALLSAFYMNELLLRFLTRRDPHPDLFVHYSAALAGLAAGQASEPVLRRFELALLAEVGYGLSVAHEAETGKPLDPDGLYGYVPDAGPVPVQAGEALVLTGSQLRAIAAGEFPDASTLQLAKRLLRQLLEQHLGDRPLRTRQVLTAMRRSAKG
ncbi:MAG TPA: DNA repair protein RecO, partial [Chromatiales bacterium]|nr:DNA repair protein RecO [Chromatiales bacterium]